MIEELQQLLDRYWILQSEDADWYYRIREKEDMLREFVREKLGCQLLVNSQLAKLEKIPGSAEAWMGFQELQQPMDYAFLLLCLSYLEDKAREEQFILSDLTEYIAGLYPGSEPVDWTVFQQRRCLVRVLRLLRDYHVIRVTDGDQEEFSQSEEAEVLYESTGLSRYFMRSFSRNIGEVRTGQDVLDSEWLDLEEEKGIVRRHRVYRKLLFGPVVYDQGNIGGAEQGELGVEGEGDESAIDNGEGNGRASEDPDFLYIRTYRNRLATDFEEKLRCELHIHRTSAMLVAEDGWGLGFPEASSNLSDITLQLATLIRQRTDGKLWDVSAQDTLELTEQAFLELLATCRDTYAKGWYKKYRDMSLGSLQAAVVEYMESWQMLQRNSELRTLTILPLAVKLQGMYPAAFMEKEGIAHAGKSK